MKLGLRLQILLWLGGLMVLAFAGLFFAVATYTNYTLQQVRLEHARSLGRAIAGHVNEARSVRSHDTLSNLLSAEVGTQGVAAIGVYDTQGKRLLASGNPDAVDRLSETILPGREALHELRIGNSPMLSVTVPGQRGAVVALLRTDDGASRAKPLVRLTGLYMGVIALALLLVTYFALTRLIVQPLDALGRAAERVAAGARRLEVPSGGALELTRVASSLKVMTEKLLGEEQALRLKIDEVERATEGLKQAQDRLIRSERLASVGRLAAGLAHEIGNPISALIGLEDLLIEGGLSPAEQHDFLLRMRRETERINRILRDLLQFARPTSSSTPGQGDPGSVELAIEDTLALVAPQKSLKGIEVSTQVNAPLPAVAMPREQLVQVMLNLILNAADACGNGGHIQVAAFLVSDNDFVEVGVEDDGPGIPQEIRQRLFEPFVTTKEAGKGTGLGLAVCRGLVDAAGGSIHYDPEFRPGARFVVRLPVSDAAT